MVFLHLFFTLEHLEGHGSQVVNGTQRVNQLIEPNLMMVIHMTFSKKSTPPTPSTLRSPLHTLHLPIQNILLAVNPFHCFFAKS